GAGLAQDKDGRHRGADAVAVVVAVHADALPRRNRGPDALDLTGHVAEQEGIVQGLFPREEHPRLLGVAVAAPDEHACRDLAEAKLLGEETGLPVRARTDRPGALLHRPPKLRRASDDIHVRCKRAAPSRLEIPVVTGKRAGVSCGSGLAARAENPRERSVRGRLIAGARGDG